MALQAQQICSLAATMAHTKGMVVLAGQLLNSVLSDLCQTYDFAVALTTAQVTISPGGDESGFIIPPLILNTLMPGSGPYALPANYLRMAQNEALYVIDGVPYVMKNVALSEFDALVQQAGINNYPQFFATDLSSEPPALYVWPPSGGAYIVQIRYYAQMADIATPETSTVIPWFPNQTYLVTRVAGEMMKLADDARWEKFLDAGASGAQGILDRYLKLQSDDEGRAQTVALDRRRFGIPFSRLPNTKLIGW